MMNKSIILERPNKLSVQSSHPVHGKPDKSFCSLYLSVILSVDFVVETRLNTEPQNVDGSSAQTRRVSDVSPSTTCLETDY